MLRMINEVKLGTYKYRLAQLLQGRRRNWSPEVALRYLPVVAELKQHGLEGCVTEVGSGSSGAAPYLGKKMVGVDTAFLGEEDELLQQVNASALHIPYPDESRPAVISVDMLEHIPPNLRDQAIGEIVRVASQLAIIVFPEGPRAERQDGSLELLYRRHHSEGFHFLDEHLEYGLPRLEELERSLRSAFDVHGRDATITWKGNSNLFIRAGLMKAWIRKGRLGTGLWLLSVRLAPLLRFAHFGPTYRKMIIVEFAGKRGALDRRT